MSSPDDLLKRKLEREISARKQAESLLEQKSLELFIEGQERQEALARLKESEERYRQIVEMSPDAILVEINGTLVFANSAARQLFAESPLRKLVGSTLEELGLDEHCVELTEDMSSRSEALAIRLDGSRCEVALRILPLVYDGRPARQLVARDISDRKRLEKQLAYQATHDPLTGVSNRSALLEQLSDALVLARRNHWPVWVAFLDLDRFKQVNDLFGHRAGDRLLSELTTRLQKVLREDDIIGRYGGDEFIIVMRGGPSGQLNPPLLQRILQLVSQPVEVDSYQLQVTGSLGVAAYPEDGDTAELLLERADAAMYQAKQAGRNLYQVFNPEIHARLVEQAHIEGALVQALERGEFRLMYQPKVDIATGAVTGAEALLRWQHPELGELSPDRFIAFAEQSTLINRIGEWVLIEACHECMRWSAQGLGEMTVAVNLSVRQLNGLQLIRLVEKALLVSGLPAQRLELELTETVMMSDVQLTMDTLHSLHARGVRIAIDDFGTGYSSFAYLNRLPLSTLKIDKQFVSGLDQPETMVITRALIQLAHNLGLSVVAEGVETAPQFLQLRMQGCDQIQGWLHSKAMNPDAFVAMLRSYVADTWLAGMATAAGNERLTA